MAELLSAGVFIEERSSDAQVVEAVSTSNMGIVGFSPRGPSDEARLVGSWDEYETVFGGLSRKSLLGQQVFAFYQNGGRRCFVVRTTPSDARKANAQLQFPVVDQQLSHGDASPASIIFTASASPILDHGGISPVVRGSLSLRYRGALAAITYQPCRQRNGSTALSADGAAFRYEGRIDQMSTLYVPGVGPGLAGAMLYRSLTQPRRDITVAHVDGGPATVLSVVVLGTAITVNFDSLNVAHTAAAVAATFLLVPAAVALATATPLGVGQIAALVATNLNGVPVYDTEIDQIVPNSLTLTFTRGGAPITIAFAGVNTNPVQTKTNGTSDTATINLRTGFFSLWANPLLAAPDIGTPITAALTPATDTITITTGSTIDPGTGRVPFVGTQVDTGGFPYPANDYLVLDSGEVNLHFVAGATNRPHDRARVMASYTINAWDAWVVSKGLWGNDVKLSITGNSDWYGRREDSAGVVQTAPGQYGRYDVTVQALNSSTLQYEPKERYTEVNFEYATNSAYFPDVVNEMSDLIRITDPGSDERPLQLNCIERTEYIGGGGGAGTALSTIINFFAAPLALTQRTVVITYTDTTGTLRTITDDGNGYLTGDVDGTYATVSSSGLAPNALSYTTGELNFRTKYAVQGGTLIKAVYRQAIASDTMTETFGDTTKDYSYTYLATTHLYYQAGTDGTFSSTYWGRSQFTSPVLQAGYQGMYALSKVEEIMQVVIPDFAGQQDVSLDQIAYAESRVALPSGGDRFIILSPPQGYDPQEAVEWVQFTLATFSKYAAVYWPWVRISDPLNRNQPTTVPNLGYIAGIYARTDATKNVGKAPAGTVDGQIYGVIDLEYSPSQADRDYVYPRRVNPLIRSSRTGTAVWGCVTLSALSSWKNVNAVRLFMFCEASVYNSTFWTCFENNGPNLWSRMQLQLNGFFKDLFNNGYFRGSTPTQAYDVKCDTTNNTEESQDQGQIICDIGIAPNRPAQFARFRFYQRSLGGA